VITLSKLNHILHQQSAGCCFPLHLNRVFFLYYELSVIYFFIARFFFFHFSYYLMTILWLAISLFSHKINERKFADATHSNNNIEYLFNNNNNHHRYNLPYLWLFRMENNILFLIILNAVKKLWMLYHTCKLSDNAESSKYILYPCNIFFSVMFKQGRFILAYHIRLYKNM
jgi:hypothetical protein